MQLTDEELFSHNSAEIMEILLKYSRKKNWLAKFRLLSQSGILGELLEALSQVLPDQRYLRDVVDYMLVGMVDSNSHNIETILEVFMSVSPQAKEVVRNYRDEWLEQGLEEGIQQGIQQDIQRGIQQGKEAAMRQIVQYMKQQGVSETEIIRFTGLNIKQIEIFLGTASVE